MLAEYKIDFFPSLSDFSTLMSWGESGTVDPVEVFLNQADTIRQRFERKTAAVVKVNDNVVAFTTWTEEDQIVYLDYLAVLPSYRKMGLGKLLINRLNERLAKNGSIAIYLFASSAEANQFWKRMGAGRFPEIDGYGSKSAVYYHLSLGPAAVQQNLPGPAGRIEMWFGGRHEMDRRPPDLCCQLRLKPESDLLIAPIINPAHQDWHMRLTENERVTFEGKIKNFASGSCYRAPFLVIDRLPVRRENV